MTHRIADPLPSTRAALPALRIAAATVVLGMLSGCSAPATPREPRSTSPAASASAEGTPSPSPDLDVFSFADGAGLAAEADISWGDGLFADEGWTRAPSEQPGRWSYVKAGGTCTAAFRGGVLGEANGMDDQEATDAMMEQQAGADWAGQEMLSDGIFLPHDQTRGAVAHRQFSYTANEFGYFMAARAFVQADYSVWVIITCEGEPLGPVVQEVLSKNVIAIDG